MTDTKSAVRWVLAHSGQLSVDPNRIAGPGGSAGGHMALSGAVFDTFDEPGEDERDSPCYSEAANNPTLLAPALRHHCGICWRMARIHARDRRTIQLMALRCGDALVRSLQALTR